MKKIIQLYKSDLFKVELFILNQKLDFDKFKKIGWCFKNIENHFNKNNNLSIGYFYKNELIGIMIGEKIVNEKNFDLEMHLIFISKKNRRQNIASSILDFIEINKNLLNISKIYLEVSENNLGAIAFYEKNNFVFLKFRHNYYNYKNKIINAKCYTKKI